MPKKTKTTTTISAETNTSVDNTISAPATEPDCPICANKYTKSTRVKCACPYCGFEACRQCNEKYLLTETIPKCMNTQCGREWTRKYLTDQFSKAFVSQTYKKHREQVLFDKERALMPATQGHVQMEIQMEQLHKETQELDNEISELIRQKHDNQRQITRLMYNLNGEELRTTETYTRACPSENCRGFLSTQWKCGTCEQWTCSECHVIKGATRDAPHTCNPDDVATAALLSSDTRPCPKCHIPIHKISGCAQMWCVQCHTAFNWNTGHIETRIHNPHYFEWLQQNATANPDEPEPQRLIEEMNCNAMDVIDRLENILAILRRWNLSSVERRFIAAYERAITAQLPDTHMLHTHIKNPYLFIQRLIHLRENDYAQFQTIIANQERSNRLWRIQYMRNKITEEYFKRIIHQTNQKVEKSREYANVLDVFIQASTDILFRLVRHYEEHLEIDVNTLKETTGLVEYVNTCLEEISKTYRCVCMEISSRMLLEKKK